MYFIDRCRKKESKIMTRQAEDTHATNELLRFNVLCRKAAVLTSKGSKSEEMMSYLDDEFDRIDKEMDLIAKALEEEDDDSINDEEQHNDGVQATSSTIIEESLQLQDPKRIKRKGQPKKPKRLKTIVEEIREKIAATKAKKKKKAANSSKRSQLRFFSKTNKRIIKN